MPGYFPGQAVAALAFVVNRIAPLGLATPVQFQRMYKIPIESERDRLARGPRHRSRLMVDWVARWPQHYLADQTARRPWHRLWLILADWKTRRSQHRLADGKAQRLPHRLWWPLMDWKTQRPQHHLPPTLKGLKKKKRS